MGEAKRKNKQARKVEDVLRERIRAGEFGEPGTLARFCVVLDKSQRAADTVKALRSLPEATAIQALMESLELQLWDASSIFPYALLVSGGGGAKDRVLLAANLDKLEEMLSKAYAGQSSASTSPGLLLAVADEVEGVIQEKVRKLRSS